MTGLLLAIDTSTAWAGVALFGGQVRYELNWRAGRRHSEQVTPAVEQALNTLGYTPKDLTVIGVARGPGSYTGVRVGITLARVMAFALSIPVLGVNSLDIVAHEHALSALPVRPLLDAGRGRFATALYRTRNHNLERITEVQSTDESALGALLTEKTLICGDLAPTTRELLTSSFGDLAVLPGESGVLRRSAVLAELAWKAWESGDTAARQTDPIYITNNDS